jgi:hypothetical protein
VGWKLDAIEREGGGLNAPQIGDERATGLAALGMPLERPLPRRIERAVDELGDRVAEIAAIHNGFRLSALCFRAGPCHALRTAFPNAARGLKSRATD